jgi:hypothetical protein
MSGFETSASSDNSQRINLQDWYRPTISPEHGIYLVLLVSFVLGAAAARNWTWMTTLALMCAFCAFQAEHPLIWQIKQRRTLKLRFLLWGSVYGGISIAIAIYLYLQQSTNREFSPLLWVYLGGTIVTIIDAIAVLYRQQKSIWNELITFGAVCSSSLLAYITIAGHFSLLAVGIWLLNWLFFSSTIFTVKLRKPRSSSIVPGVIYHAIASLIIFVLWAYTSLPTIAAIAFGIAVLKFGLIAWQQSWYCQLKISQVAMLETIAATVFLIIVALSLLPARLG